MQLTFSCFCIKCTSPFIHTTNTKDHQINCPKCGYTHDVYELPNLAYQISKEIKRLIKKYHFLKVAYFARVEFEQDYKLYTNTDEYFEDACELFTIHANPDRKNPPRFDIVAHLFKTQDNYRFLLHDTSVNPTLYDIDAFFNRKATFDETLTTPHIYIFPEDSKSKQLKLFDFAHLAYLSKLYVSYYQYLTQKKSLFLLPYLEEA